MKIPSAIYGALGGAAAASAVWMAASPAPAPEPTKVDGYPSPPSAQVQAQRPPTAILDSAPRFTTEEKAAFSAQAAENNRPLTRSFATRVNKAAPQPERELTRAELNVRAALVEEQANARLGELALRLNLTEEQQDRIFPILASSSPAFHPILIPEGGSGGTTTTTAPSTGTVYGDGSDLSPGAPIAEVENEIYGELDDIQQASLEEEAMDREAWWEDIVGLLEEDLESSTDGGAISGEDGNSNTAPTEEFTDEERDEASETNEVDDFSNLLFGN